MAYDVLSIGDATLDVFLEVDEAEVTCDLDRDNCKICFNYADKLPVRKVTKVAGAGNASNNAVGSARLGLNTAIYSILGDDDVGEQIHKHWKDEGVHLKHVLFDKGKGTNYSTVINYRGERTILVFHEHREYAFPKKLPDTKWIYYTSMGKGSDVMHEPLVRHLGENGTKLCLQPGTFQMQLGLDGLRPLMEVSEVFVVNKEEAERVLGLETTEIKTLLRKIHDIGVKIVIITDGPDGSSTFDGNKYLKLGIFDTPVVERTGVGDAYATAFVAALASGESVADAMRWGTANSASVIGKIGPQAGLLHKDELQEMLDRFDAQHPEEF